MFGNKYRFRTHWQIKGKLEEVFEVLYKFQEFPRWWPAVYLDIQILKPSDKKGLGQITEAWLKSFLPYSLNWLFKTTEVYKPNTIAFEAWGDFVGKGNCTLRQNGQIVDIFFDWKIKPEKEIFRNLSLLLKPLWKANYIWAMQKGEESLKLELARRNAKSEDELRTIPLPPKPTPSTSLPLVLAAVGGITVLSILYNLIKRNSLSKGAEGFLL